ncbi:hypothetical protein DH2020_002306 [Rehmannia glutinosa]|uniref:Uncharacterized protein n=1 Tax=Rehmannia glutinosa TaxID=99300 RepID=A0ABR0XTT0_REHGL
MNGKVTRPPPPVRRLSSITGVDGHVFKGLSGNMDKSRGATRLISKECLKLAKNSKHTYFEDSHSYAEGSGTNRFTSLENGDFQPLDTSSQLINGSDQVNGFHLDDRTDSIIAGKNLVGDVATARIDCTASIRNPNIMGDSSCLKARLENGDSKKKKTDFANIKEKLTVESVPRQDMDNKKGCSTILYSNKDRVADEHASWNGLNGLENGVIIPSAVNGSPTCTSHFSPTLSSFKKNKDTHGTFAGTFRTTNNCYMGPSFLNDNKTPVSYLEITPVGPQNSSDNMDIIGQNCSNSLNLNMVEIVGDNIFNGSDFMVDSAAGMLKGDNCGTLSFRPHNPPFFLIRMRRVTTLVDQVFFVPFV